MFLTIICILFFAGQASANLITVNNDQFTYRLTQSTGSFVMWTTPQTKRIRSTSTAVPTASGSGLSVSCARQEFESFQLIIAPTTIGSMVVSFTNFAGLSAGSAFEVGTTTWVGASPWAQGTFQVTDNIVPITSGAMVPLSSTLPTVIWMTVYVDLNACGRSTYNTNLVLTPAGQAAINVPISLYVFNFVIDTKAHMATYFQSQPLFQGCCYTLPQLDQMKQVYYNHRMSSRGPAWPNGLSYRVAWNQGTKTLIDTDPATSTQSCIWANGCTTRRYVVGAGGVWRGQNYANWHTDLGGFTTMEITNVEYSRPATFNGVACGSKAGFTSSWYSGWMCSDAYETEWYSYLTAAYNYLRNNGFYADPEFPKTKGFFYTLNEPQAWKDYTISAYMCQQTKARVPGLPLMVTREAHPWIFDAAVRGDGLACGYDIWTAHINRFPYSITWERQATNGETSWVYMLDSDAGCFQAQCSPTIFPFVSRTGSNSANDPLATNEGMHYRGIPWVLWSMRAEGWGYYHDDILWDNSLMNAGGGWQPARPKVPAALVREGMEDYEYLYLANCRRRPSVRKRNAVDLTALSLGFNIGTWNKNEEQSSAIRLELGKYLEGTRPDMPYLATPGMFAFGNWNFDFKQDPGTNTRFNFGGLDWIPVDINQNFDVAKGFGFTSALMGVSERVGVPWLFCDVLTAGDLITNTVCYDNSNHNNYFFVSLHPGVYTVTVGLGMPGRTRNDIEYVEINNVILRNVTCSTIGGCVGNREYTQQVTVHSHGTGGILAMSFGSPYINEYTVISHLKIVGVTRGTIVDESPCAPTILPTCGGTTAPPVLTTAPPVATTVPPVVTTVPPVATTVPPGGTTTPVPGGTTTPVPGGTTTPVPGGTTTPVPGGTTTPVPGGTTTPVPGGTTTPVPGGTTTPVPGGTTTPVPGGTTTPVPGTTAAPGTTVPNNCPGTCCLFSAARPGFVPFTLRLNLAFRTFDCAGFPRVLAAQTGSPYTSISLFTAVDGSVILTGAIDPSTGTALINVVESGQATLPFTRLNVNGREAVIPGSSFPWWAILLIVLGVLILVVVLIIIIVLCKRKQDKKGGNYYEFRETKEDRGNYQPVTTNYPAVRTSNANPDMVKLVLQHNVIDHGEGVLQAKQGDVCFATTNDFNAETDWLWVKLGAREGYVPKSYCQRFK